VLGEEIIYRSKNLNDISVCHNINQIRLTSSYKYHVIANPEAIAEKLKTQTVSQAFSINMIDSVLIFGY